MDDRRRSRIQELERLRGELAQVGRLIDELERRQIARDQKKTADPIFDAEVYSNDAETRFAACISHGLAKLNSK